MVNIHTPHAFGWKACKDARPILSDLIAFQSFALALAFKYTFTTMAKRKGGNHYDQALTNTRPLWPTLWPSKFSKGTGLPENCNSSRAVCITQLLSQADKRAFAIENDLQVLGP